MEKSTSPNRIKELRERHGLSQAAVAKVAGTNAGQIQKLENGIRRLTVQWMERIAPAFDLPPEALIAQTEKEKHAGKEHASATMAATKCILQYLETAYPRYTSWPSHDIIGLAIDNLRARILSRWEDNKNPEIDDELVQLYLGNAELTIRRTQEQRGNMRQGGDAQEKKSG